VVFKDFSEVISLLVHDARPTHFEVMHKPNFIHLAIAPENESPATKKRYRLTVTVPTGIVATPERDVIIIKTDHPKVAALNDSIRYAPCPRFA
jgi:hypothetical protein